MLRLWLRWVTANALAETIGLGAGAFVGAMLAPRLDASNDLLPALTFALVMIGMGSLEGLFVGFAQWHAMRNQFPEIQRKSWVWATVIGAFTAWTLGMLPSTLIGLSGNQTTSATPEFDDRLIYALAVIMGGVLGIVLAYAQWWVFRRSVRHAWIWLPANALAWMVGMPVIFYAASTIPEQATVANIALYVLVILAIAGALVGAVHGLFLIRLANLRMRKYRSV